jgi:hypothetical protein
MDRRRVEERLDARAVGRRGEVSIEARRSQPRCVGPAQIEEGLDGDHLALLAQRAPRIARGVTIGLRKGAGRVRGQRSCACSSIETSLSWVAAAAGEPLAGDGEGETSGGDAGPGADGGSTLGSSGAAMVGGVGRGDCGAATDAVDTAGAGDARRTSRTVT